MSVPRYAVIGQPVSHSLSPAIFTFLFDRMGVAGEYLTRETAPGDLGAVAEEMRRGDWQGLSVTVPHKLAIREFIDEESPLATRIGAVNTLALKAGRILGDNTDAYGCRRALEQAGAQLSGANVVVLGAGGAARAAVFAMLDAGAKSIAIANRTRANAEALALDSGAEAVELSQLSLESADILIQSSTAGMNAPDQSLLSESVNLPSRLYVLDMVYRPLDTALIRRAAASGCKTVDGLWMLVHQALQQFRIWTGREAPEETARALHQYLRGAAT